MKTTGFWKFFTVFLFSSLHFTSCISFDLILIDWLTDWMMNAVVWLIEILDMCDVWVHFIFVLWANLSIFINTWNHSTMTFERFVIDCPTAVRSNPQTIFKRKKMKVLNLKYRNTKTLCTFRTSNHSRWRIYWETIDWRTRLWCDPSSNYETTPSRSNISDPFLDVMWFWFSFSFSFWFNFCSLWSFIDFDV